MYPVNAHLSQFSPAPILSMPVASLFFLFAWQAVRTAGISAAILTGAVAAGLLVQFLLYAVLQRFALGKPGGLRRLLLEKTKSPARYIFPLIALSLALPFTPLPERSIPYVSRALNLCLIAAVGWAFVVAIQVIGGLLTFRYSIDVEDNLQARRIRTQTQVIQRIVIVMIIVITAAAMLMTFPNARQIGASIFASAGLAGLVVGMAARPTLASLIAGLQVAITQPIRIDDSVVVEGEWGWIEEIETTYVVVRLWDLRRLILPLTYFIEKPFQNWTRTTADLLGTVMIYVDYSLPVEPLRQELQRVLKTTPLWDGKTWGLQVTDLTENTMQIRALMSASSAPKTFDLRCYVREKLIKFLQEKYPQCLPQRRENLLLDNGPATTE